MAETSDPIKYLFIYVFTHNWGKQCNWKLNQELGSSPAALDIEE